MKANREYKSSVFALLFSDKARLLELYNAVEGTDYTDTDDIEINTLQDALFLGRVNDVSFLFRERLVMLYEHQSTVNPNMALRMLMYVSRIYEGMVESKLLYSSKPAAIPPPVAVVFYNGEEDLPARMTVKLSDLFIKSPECDKIGMELEVTVYNINKGKNPALETRSGTLSGYAKLMARIRRNWKRMADKEEAVREAVNYCKRHGILYDFLCQYGSEVENMLFNDCTVEDVLELRWEEGLEKGREEGWEEGREERAWEIARDLKDLGVTIEQISRATKLPAEEIAAL